MSVDPREEELRAFSHRYFPWTQDKVLPQPLLFFVYNPNWLRTNSVASMKHPSNTLYFSSLVSSYFAKSLFGAFGPLTPSFLPLQLQQKQSKQHTHIISTSVQVTHHRHVLIRL